MTGTGVRGVEIGDTYSTAEEKWQARPCRLIHEGGWRLRGDPEGDLTWVRPNGRPLEAGAGLARAGPAP